MLSSTESLDSEPLESPKFIGKRSVHAGAYAMHRYDQGTEQLKWKPTMYETRTKEITWMLHIVITLREPWDVYTRGVTLLDAFMHRVNDIGTFTSREISAGVLYVAHSTSHSRPITWTEWSLWLPGITRDAWTDAQGLVIRVLAMDFGIQPVIPSQFAQIIIDRAGVPEIWQDVLMIIVRTTLSVDTWWRHPSVIARAAIYEATYGRDVWDPEPERLSRSIQSYIGRFIFPKYTFTC